jgi:hypothetical protein
MEREAAGRQTRRKPNQNAEGIIQMVAAACLLPQQAAAVIRTPGEAVVHMLLVQARHAMSALR